MKLRLLNLHNILVLKKSLSKLLKYYEYESNDVNEIFNLPILSSLVKAFTKCKHCDETDWISLALHESYTNGLAYRIIIKCDKCPMEEACINSIRNLHEVNIRFAYALRSIGKGIEAGKMFCAVMNLAPPNSRIQHYNEKIFPKPTEVCEACLLYTSRCV